MKTPRVIRQSPYSRVGHWVLDGILCTAVLLAIAAAFKFIK